MSRYDGYSPRYTSDDRVDIVIDIETLGPRWEEIDAPTQEYLTERAKNRAKWDGETLTEEQAAEVAAERLALDTGLASVAAIGMYSLRKTRPRVLVPVAAETAVDGHIPLEVDVDWHENERAMLSRFWRYLKEIGNSRIVTFNGRGFDGPNLMIRSAMLDITCTRDLVGNRYYVDNNLDLQHALAFMGAVRGGYGLEYWCLRFDIPSPKDQGIDGSDVERLVRAGEWHLLINYVGGDVLRSGQLYQRMQHFLHLFKGGPAAPQRSEQVGFALQA